MTVFPHTVDAGELARYDAVLLSNGPGDPEPLGYEIQVVRDLLGRVPILGICLGHQLLGLATGHETYKLPLRPPRRQSPGARAVDRTACS